MPITDYDCPNCGTPVHTDGLIEGYHALGCEEPFDDEWLAECGW